MLACLNTMRLELAVSMMRDTPIRLERSDFETILAPMTEGLRRAQRSGKTGEAHRLFRRIYAIKGFRDHGPNPIGMINISDLQEGYDGKILLVRLAGGVIENMVCLRSGDDWHRAILANTREEIRDLGFDGCIVHELGGASACFQPNGSITIWGTSEDFGACDKGVTAALISKAHPGNQIILSD